MSYAFRVTVHTDCHLLLGLVASPNVCLFVRFAQGPAEMPEFGPSGYLEKGKYAYPETDHGREVYYNAYDDLDTTPQAWTHSEFDPLDVLTPAFLVY